MSRMIQDSFLAIPNSLLFCKGIVHNSKNIPLGLSDKILWCYMRQRYVYFVEISGVKYRDSDLQLSMKLQINKRRVIEFISKLESLNLITRVPLNPSNPRSQKHYTNIVDPLSLQFY